MRKKMPNGYWTYEKCFEAAKSCTSRTEFILRYATAYSYAKKNMWLDEFYSHMKLLGNRHKRCIYSYEFIEEKCVYVGLTYSISAREMYRNSNDRDQVTKYINKTGYEPIIKQLTDYVEVEIASKLEGEYLKQYETDGWKILNVAKTGGIGGNSLIWTKELCDIEAKKFNTRNDFRIKSISAYGSAWKNGWLNDICLHMVDGRVIWTKEKCMNEAKLYVNKKEFQRKSCGAYKSAIKNGWLNEISLHMNRPKRTTKWTFIKCSDIAIKCNNKKEFRIMSSGAYQSAMRNGWLDSICKHMDRLPYNVIYWTRENCENAAKECKTKIEFYNKFSGAYYRSRVNGWLNEFFENK